MRPQPYGPAAQSTHRPPRKWAGATGDAPPGRTGRWQTGTARRAPPHRPSGLVTAHVSRGRAERSGTRGAGGVPSTGRHPGRLAGRFLGVSTQHRPVWTRLLPGLGESVSAMSADSTHIRDGALRPGPLGVDRPGRPSLPLPWQDVSVVGALGVGAVSGPLVQLGRILCSRGPTPE